jgi:type II secretory pathway pseudopilin PulG
MTLVELLVVMAIIVIFTAMTAAFYPANQADRELSRFSNTVQSALLSARNRAKADRLPTGIRFYDSDANGKCCQCLQLCTAISLVCLPVWAPRPPIPTHSGSQWLLQERSCPTFTHPCLKYPIGPRFRT